MLSARLNLITIKVDTWYLCKRDWGHAKDYVEAMWKMLQQKKT